MSLKHTQLESQLAGHGVVAMALPLGDVIMLATKG